MLGGRVISAPLGFYTSSLVHTEGPSSKVITRIDVMQRHSCNFAVSSAHRASAHDAACVFGVAVCVLQRPQGDRDQKPLRE